MYEETSHSSGGNAALMFISCFFLVNQISFKLLDDIQETELKELIPSLKEKILFKRGLTKLQNIIHVSVQYYFFQNFLVSPKFLRDPDRIILLMVV